MSKSILKCYFGCAIDDGPLHKFPSWEYPHTERFNKWKAVLDQTTQQKGNNHIYYTLRLCNKHFEDYYISKHSRRLTGNAVPTLNLLLSNQVETDNKPNQPQRSQTNTTILENQVKTDNTIQQLQCSLTANLPVLESQVETKNALNQSQCSETNLTEQHLSHTDLPNVENQKSVSADNTLLLPQPSSSRNVEEFENKHNEASKRSHSDAFKSEDLSHHDKQSKPKRTCLKRIISYKQRWQHQDITVTKLKEKVIKLQKKCRTLKGQILTARKLSRSKSFLKTINKFPSSMQFFLQMQVQFKKKPRGRRFTVEEKIMALTIYKQGPKVYKLLQKMFVLPSRRCLQKLLSALTISPGINKHVMKTLKEAVSNMSEEKKLVNLLFDEVSLAPGVQYNPSKDEIMGFEDSGTNKNKVLADHALVLMIKGIKGKTKQPISFSFCKSSTKKHVLKEIIITAIRELREIGLKVICTICDQSSTNVSVIKSLKEDTRVKYLKEGEEFHSTSFEIDSIKVYPLFDTPHLLKGVRNNLLTKNATFVQDGKNKCAKWEHLELLLEIDEGEDEIRLVNKLTENHVKKDKIPKMRVKFAAQVFSQRVSAAMRFLAKRNILPAECEDTADFLLIFDKLFDSFNSHSYQDQPKVYKSCLKNNSPHFKLWSDLIPILESIKFKSIEKRNGTELIKHESVPSIKNWIDNIKCFNEMWKDLKNNYGIKNLITRNFNQDPLENFFSSIRSNGVRNVNPNCLQFTNAYKTLTVNNFNSPHSPGANCEIDNDNCMQSLKNLIIDRNESMMHDDSIPDFACEIDSLLNIISEIKNSDSTIHTEAKKYVSGYVIKKCRTKIFKTCKNCNNDLCRSEVDVDSFNYEIDYTKKSLFHPSNQFSSLMNEIYYVISACLRDFPHAKFLKRKISSFIDCSCDFSMITCEDHKTDLIDYIKNLSINVVVHSWCNGVNRIINGKFLKFDQNDSIKNQAYDYLIKHRKMKKQ